MAVARYIVLNAVRAGLVDHPRKWKWCSYSSTAGTAKTPDWLFVDWILGNFCNERIVAQREYRRFVMDGVDAPEPYEDLQHDFILGTTRFVHWIWDNYTAGSEPLKEYPREQRIVGRPGLEEIFANNANNMTKQEREAAIIFARIRCGYLTTEIAKYVGLDRSVVGKISRGKYNLNKKSP